jgi:hypothetical protein
MKNLILSGTCAVAALVGLALVATGAAQTAGEKESYTAVAIVNNNLRSGAGNVLIDITRWSTEAERAKLVSTLLELGPQELLKELRNSRSTGTIRTPDTLAFDLRYANQTPLGDGSRRIVLATDRPIGFWEASHQPRTIDYPFTVIQMEIDRNGRGKGTMSYATKITAVGKTIELENFTTSPVMLTEIRARGRD